MSPSTRPRRVTRSKPTVVAPAPPQLEEADPRVDALVQEIIGRIADKWTMVVLEVLAEHGTLRFGQLATLCGGISQKMLTQTLRQMERDGLLMRTVYPVIPPKVEYRRTELGDTLGLAFCGVWRWAAANRERIEAARAEFDRSRVPDAVR